MTTRLSKKNEEILNLGTIPIGKDANYAANSTSGKDFFIPLQKMATRALRWNLKTTVYIFHEHIEEVVFFK